MRGQKETVVAGAQRGSVSSEHNVIYQTPHTVTSQSALKVIESMHSPDNVHSHTTETHTTERNTD
jgi:hypothetical protein